MKNCRLHYLLVALLCMGSFPVCAQDQKGNGNVVQEQSLTPLTSISTHVPQSAGGSDSGRSLLLAQVPQTPVLAPAAEPAPVPVQDATATDDNGNALIRIDRFLIKGNTLLNPALLERLVEPYKGRNRSYTDIQLALEAIEGAYRNAGYSAVHVVTPEQEITDGTITLQVVETVIGKVILKGNKYYDKKNIRNALPALSEGSTPNARALSRNIRLANENPTRQIDVVLAVGDEDSTVDANVKRGRKFAT